MSETAAQSHVSGLAADTDQFLTFTIEDEEYGIEILSVQEIKGISKIRPIPNFPWHGKSRRETRLAAQNRPTGQ